MRTKGPIFGDIFASRLAKYFEIPIRHYEKEEKLLPPIFLDYKSMVAHDFILKYNLIFDKNYCEIITLPAPSLFNIFSSKYLILPEDIHAYLSAAPAPEDEPEPHLTLIDSLFISGIQRKLLTSGTLRTSLSTPERVALIHGHRPT